MFDPIPQALRLLGHFWLEEVKGADLETIATLPELAEALPELDEAVLTTLAVEYQHLFGFNLPPYESVFIDPSGMLMAPATGRVQRLYRQGGWEFPPGTRVGAPDHLGLELLALADWLETNPMLAQQLHTRHLAVWGPLLVLTLRRLKPHPFYVTLGELTLALILSLLPERVGPEPEDLFPALPSPPVYRGSESLPVGPEAEAIAEAISSPPDETTFSLRPLIRQLLSPREAGLYLTREDLARIGHRLALPGVMGERYRLLETLLQQAIQYDLLAALSDQLNEILVEAGQAYTSLAGEYPAWAPYAEAWSKRLGAARMVGEELKMMRRVADEQ